MKKLLLALAFLLPFAASAAIATPWNATSTDKGYITPNLINGNAPYLLISGTGTSTFAGAVRATCFTTNGTTCIGSGGSGTVSQINTTYPITGGPITTTGTLALAFGTSTSNIWGGTQTFTNSPVFSTIGAGTVNATAAGTIYNTATTSLSVGSPLTVTGTFGALIGGTNSTINCQTASGSQAGCLSSTDWTTFNNKGSGTVTAISVASANGFAGSSSGGATPILTLSTSISGVLKGNGTAISAAANGTDYTLITANSCSVGQHVSAITAAGVITCSPDTGSGGSGLATTTPISSGNLLAYTSSGAGAAYGVATGTIANSTGISVTAGQSVIGTGLTITNTSPLSGLLATFPFSFTGGNTLTWNGLSTSSPGITSGQPIYATGPNTIASVASSTFLTSIGGQASGNYITALTGDVTATGPGSVAATLATVNGNVGSFTNANITVNGKGLITAASNGTAPTTYTGTYPIQVTGSVISTAFGTTTSNTFAGTQTFTNSPIISTLGAGTVNASANGSLYNTSTSTPTLASELTYGGTLGQFIGGVSGALSLTTNGTALSKLVQISGNTILGNNTGALGNVVAFATSTLGIAISDTTGTLTVPRGGTGQTSFTSGNLLYGNLTNALSSVATTSVTCAGTVSCSSFTAIGASPITLTGTGSSANTISTTSPISIGNLAYFTGVTPTSIGGVATGTISNGTNISVTNGSTASVLGANITINLSGTVAYGNGGTGTTTAPQGQLLYGGATGYQSVATSTATCTSASGVSCTSFSFVGPGGSTIALSAIPNSSLTNSTISGVALGGTLGALTATNGSLTFSGAYTGASAQTVGLNLANANSWSALQTFANSSTTLASFGYASSTLGYFGTLNIPSLGTAAGAFLAVDATGKVIATTTPSAGYSPIGTTGQFPYFSGTNTLTATSSIFLGVQGNIGIGTTGPAFALDLQGTTSLAAYYATRFSDDAQPTGVIARKARGQQLTPTAVLANDSLGIFGARGYGATTFSGTIAAIDLRAAENFTGSANGSMITFDTTALGATTRTSKAWLTSAGFFSIGSSSPFARLAVHANNGDTATTLFAIGSSTASATTTFLTVSNTGLFRLPLLGTAAGTLLAADPLGNVIATSTPNGNTSYGIETPSGTINGSNTAFTVGNTPTAVYLNGAFQTPGGVDYTLSGLTITFVTAPDTGSVLRSQYASAVTPTVSGSTGYVLFNNGGLIGSDSNFFWDNVKKFLGLGTTTPQWPLQVAATAKPQLTLTDTSNNTHWSFWNNLGDLFLGTSSPTTFATSTSADPFKGFIKFPSGGSCVGCSDISLTGGINLQNGQYLDATSTVSTANVQNVVYTAPAGRRAFIYGAYARNDTGSSVQFRIFYDNGGLFYPIMASSSSITTNTLNGNFVYFILNPGESISVLQSVAGIKLHINMIEFDAASPFYSSKVLNPSANATTTLYTPTAGASGACLSGQPFSGTGTGLNSNNPCPAWASPVTAAGVKAFFVKKGQVATDGFNNLTVASGVAWGASGNTGQAAPFGSVFSGSINFNPGDSLQMVTDAAPGNGSMYWVNVWDH